MKLRPYTHARGAINQTDGYHFYCPGCDSAHGFSVKPGGWQFDGNLERPTVSPSLLTTGGSDPNYRCHLFLRDGQLQFLNDCTHKLAGQTVPLPDWPY